MSRRFSIYFELPNFEIKLDLIIEFLKVHLYKTNETIIIKSYSKF